MFKKDGPTFSVSTTNNETREEWLTAQEVSDWAKGRMSGLGNKETPKLQRPRPPVLLKEGQMLEGDQTAQEISDWAKEWRDFLDRSI